MIVENFEQGSPEWLKARCGVVTASNFAKIITPGGKEVKSKGRDDYMLDLIHEKLTGEPASSYQSEAMLRGQELEPQARDAFCFMMDKDVQEVGLVYKNEDKTISCSPDGLIGVNEGLEIKCMLHKAHLTTLIEQSYPSIYKPQLQGCMWVTGRDSWWFMAYHPDHKPFICQVMRDDIYIEKMEYFVGRFIAEMEDKLKLIK